MLADVCVNFITIKVGSLKNTKFLLLIAFLCVFLNKQKPKKGRTQNSCV